jgi:hypothetical protein
MLDLQNNDICNPFGVKLLKLVKNNYFQEEVNLKGNKKINYSHVESIDDECRKNHLIKKYIIPQIRVVSKNKSHHNQKKAVELKLVNQTFY